MTSLKILTLKTTGNIDSNLQTTSKKQKRQDAADKRRQLQPLRNKVKKLEGQMEKLNAEKDELSEQLASNTLYEDKNKSQLNDCLAQQGKVIQELQDIEEQWLTASEELETLI